MPAIDPKFLKCIAYLYPSQEAAQAGERVGGTAFFVGWSSPGDERRYVNYVVTNKHLIDGGCRFLRIALSDGTPFADDVPVDLWTFSADDDLAIAAIGMPENHDIVPIGHDMLLDDRCAIADWPIFPGDDVILYGRLLSHDGKQRNKPVVRFGSIAMLPDAHVPIDFGDHQQVAFLVECRSLGGSSGSPAFVQLADHRLLYHDTVPPKDRWIPNSIRCLGVNCGHLPFYTRARKQPSPAAEQIPDLHVESGSGVAVVIPAWKVMAMLNQEHFVRQRDELFKKASVTEELSHKRKGPPTDVPFG